MTIPDDIREKARVIRKQIYGRVSYFNRNSSECLDELEEITALAILAERERCGEIAKNWHYKKGGYCELAYAILTPDGEKHEAK